MMGSVYAGGIRTSKVYKLTFDTQTRCACLHSCQCMFNLHQLSGRREGCKGEAKAGKSLSVSVLLQTVPSFDPRVSTTTGDRHCVIRFSVSSWVSTLTDELKLKGMRIHLLIVIHHHYSTPDHASQASMR